MKKNNLMSVADYAAKYGVSPSHIRNLITEGKIEAEMISGSYFIDKKTPMPPFGKIGRPSAAEVLAKI